MITDEQYDNVSQKAHVCGGALVAPYAVHLFGPMSMWYVVVMFLVWAAIKEFWYDQEFETPEIRGSNARDFFFYCAGTLIGVIVNYLPTWFVLLKGLVRL